ncbi:hypothetical protein [Aliikangiella coralliicola]|uniref:Uncharacterized protein n=1 Tax=Aliikangiella coralliicola TaxID=2592383 RepID=A0A545UJB4_9GAMM|nr:hypothetical protein [Aliikangiella coralliicola]TQV89551.1 hypothetical protein FLL46_01315 [Aliikangiella coralliicola]
MKRESLTSLEQLKQLEKKLNQCQKEVRELIQLKQPPVVSARSLINIKLSGLNDYENDRLNAILNSMSFSERTNASIS